MCNKALIGKFDKKTAVIGIVGLGYIGLPLMLRYAETGYRVLGFDGFIAASFKGRSNCLLGEHHLSRHHE